MEEGGSGVFNVAGKGMPVICLWESSGRRQLSEAPSARACTRQTHAKQSDNVHIIEEAEKGTGFAGVYAKELRDRSLTRGKLLFFFKFLFM